MDIEAERNRYHGDAGWESDNNLFSQSAITWKQWLGNAGEHIYTSNLLLSEVNIQEQRVNALWKTKKPGLLPPSITSMYFFHCALSIENSFKGVISSKSSVDIKQAILDKEKMPTNILGHNLVYLASRAEYNICLDKEYALEFLTRYGVWCGKYPLPKSNTDNAMTVKLSDGNFYLVGGYNQKIIPSFLRFSETIYTWARKECDEMLTP